MSAAFPQLKTTPNEKVLIYAGCKPKCIQTQGSNPENLVFKDLPFVIETFCSCHCARTALRMSKDLLSQAGRAAVMDEDVTSLPEAARLFKRNQEVCSSALMD